jgi:hypothetical protein
VLDGVGERGAPAVRLCAIRSTAKLAKHASASALRCTNPWRRRGLRPDAIRGPLLTRLDDA